MIIAKATTEHLNELARLFNAYRVWYKKSSDLEGAIQFLKERLANNDSVMFIAWEDTQAIGFTQLYPTFSSTTMESFYILNDLFVDPAFRNQKVGASLLKHAQEYAKKEGVKGLALETGNDNPAQKLYEKLGWKKDIDFLHYFWSTKND